MSSRISIVYDADIQERVFRVMKELDYVQKIDTVLSIGVSPLTPVYTDTTITVSGILKDVDDHPLSNQTIKILNNNVVEEEVTTNSIGEYVATIDGLSVGTHTFRASYYGNDTYDNSSSSDVQITVNEHTWIITLEVTGGTIYAGDTVNISGILKKDGVGVTNASIQLYDGSTSLGTVTTGSGGTYSTTIENISSGTHTLKAHHTNTEVTNTITVLNHTYSLTCTSDKQTMYTTESVLIGGVLKKDNVAWSGQSVQIYDGSTLIDTITTGSNGSYSKSISGLSAGTHTFKAVNSNVQSSTVSVVVNEPTPAHDYALAIQSTKDILSYADSESATLTATLTDNGSAVSGETLSYVVKHGSTTIDSGSATTNSSGQISFNYTSSGVGDVDIEVDFGILLQEIYELEDCIVYDPLTSNSGKWTIPTTVNSQYSSDGWRLSSGSSYSQIKLTDKLTSPCTVEFTIVDYNSPNNGPSVLVFQYTNGETTPNQIILNSRGGDSVPSECFDKSIGHKLIKNGVYRIEYGSTMKVYENNVLLGSASNTVGLPTRFEFHMGGNGRYMVVKDLKVKAL